MFTLNCPACGAAVGFRLKSSIFAVCSYCKSSLVRHDMNLESIGKMGDLQDDVSPLQLGCSGTFNGKKFEIIGRLQVSYSEGVWNEWHLLFGTEQPGWLAEAQGFYAVCFPVTSVSAPARENLRPGLSLSLGNQGAFQVEDIHKVQCVFSE